MQVELIREDDDTYSVLVDGEPAEGLTHKPLVLAEFLAAWLVEADQACMKMVEIKRAERN